MSIYMEQFLVRILVVVAIIQMGTLKTEVEKGSMWTAIGHGLAGPKGRNCFFKVSIAMILERELG
jgi:hypothetical protein